MRQRNVNGLAGKLMVSTSEKMWESLTLLVLILIENQGIPQYGVTRKIPGISEPTKICQQKRYYIEAIKITEKHTSIIELTGLDPGQYQKQYGARITLRTRVQTKISAVKMESITQKERVIQKCSRKQEKIGAFGFHNSHEILQIDIGR